MSVIDEAMTDQDAGTIDLSTRASTVTEGDGHPESVDSGRTDPPMAHRPQFTITDAATACAVSRKTITRKLADLAEHGAAKDEDGIWRIPVEALLAVGLHPGRSLPDRPATTRPVASPPRDRVPPVAPEREMISVPRDRWDDLRIRLARAEAQAAERDLALADARLALRALTAGPADTHGAAPVPQIHTAPPAPPAPSAPPVTGAVADAPPPAAATPSPAPIVVPAAPHLGSEAPTPAAPGTSSEPGSAASPMSAPASTTVDPASQVAMARSEAARTGGYVPAASAPPKRRRWWQSRRADA